MLRKEIWPNRAMQQMLDKDSLPGGLQEPKILTFWQG
jgi:hypothetical protein